ncbi:MAG: hypothetical protein NTV99_01475 [Deltaproteobacteria bacterium]|nr:hypothetical protein [Deltaproteobacteria bacterium]
MIDSGKSENALFTLMLPDSRWLAICSDLPVKAGPMPLAGLEYEGG